MEKLDGGRGERARIHCRWHSSSVASCCTVTMELENTTIPEWKLWKGKRRLQSKVTCAAGLWEGLSGRRRATRLMRACFGCVMQKCVDEWTVRRVVLIRWEWKAVRYYSPGGWRLLQRNGQTCWPECHNIWRILKTHSVLSMTNGDMAVVAATASYAVQVQFIPAESLHFIL